MISKFFDELFDFADKTKEEKKSSSPEYKTVRQIIDLLQRVYDKGDSYSDDELTRKPTTKAEEIVFSIPGVVVYEDKQDGTLCYEIDHNHYDSAAEVITHIIDDRRRRYHALKAQYRKANEQALDNYIYSFSETLNQMLESTRKQFLERLDDVYDKK